MLASADWSPLFPLATVENLAWIESDHSPLILDSLNKHFRRKRKKKRFRFEAAWAQIEACKRVVWEAWNENSNLSFNAKLERVGEELNKWHEINIGELNRKIKRLQSELTNIRYLPPTDSILLEEKNIESQLHQALVEEERYWFQRARVQWLKEGDLNTKFFHAQASMRKKMNTITKLKNSAGEWIDTEAGIKNIVTDYFIDIFTPSSQPVENKVLDAIQVSVKPSTNANLLRPFSREEVETALKQMHPDKSPVPDGMSALFYQKFWDVVGEEVIQNCLGILQENLDIADFNHSHIVLVPKGDNPESMAHFRPISLCNVIYKLVSKVLVNRMKPYLGDCISEEQSAFVKGRQILDNVMVSHELIHSIHSQKKGKKHQLALKLDMSKAFDRVEWHFLEAVMLRMGFDQRWVCMIMRCVKSVSYSILINGEMTAEFSPGRGLRQGDPLSPFLFLICAESLSALLKQNREETDGVGIKVNAAGPTVSHLFFADDSILFSSASVKHATAIKDMIKMYEDNSGQRINFDKSSLFFSPNTPNGLKSEIQTLLGVQIVTNPDKYLGLPTLIGRGKRRAFKEIVDRVRAKINGWSKKFLSTAGREVFIKAVLQAVPIYSMQCFLLPKTLLDDITKVIRKFWWSGKIDKTGLCPLNWKKVCTPKREGGMVFRDLRLFNLALVAKQGWRLLHNQSTLCYKVLKSRYFPNNDFMNARIGSKPSFLWRCLWKSIDVLKLGTSWRVGNGNSISIFEDQWLPQNDNGYVLSSCPNIARNDTVKALTLNNGTLWNRSLIEREFEAEEASLILSIPLYGENNADRRVWRCAKSGRYSVKSGYFILLQDESEYGPHRRIWRKLWKEKVTGKIRICAWKICNEILPTAKFLNRRIPGANPRCVRCGAETEDVLHAIKNCKTAHDVLTACQIKNCILNFEPGDAATWIDFAVENSSMQEFELLLTALWILWTERNSQAHNGTNEPTDRIVSRIFSHFQEFKNTHGKDSSTQSSSSSHASRTYWNAPHLEWIKINFDASFDSSSLSGGAGVVCRDEEGFVVAAASLKLPATSSPNVAEAKAAISALETAKTKGYQDIILEGDSRIVIKSLQDDDLDLSEIGILTDKAKQLSRSFRNCLFHFVKRDANHVAHLLAKFSKTQENDLYWIVDYPQFIHQAVMFDAINI